MKNIIFIYLTASTTVLAQTNLGTIKVSGHHHTSNLVDFAPSDTKISGKELQKKRQTSLGDTMQSEAGVATTSFGPSASRPVIRGLDGDRIRLLQNGLGTLDASTQSLDHAIPIDTLTIDQIEMVRGPMSLLYGSSAVGGVVNIVTNRTKTKFEEGFSSQVLTQAESVNNGLSNAIRADYGKKGWMVHADASTRNLGNQKIPAYARTEKKRFNEPYTAGETEGKKKLPNSFNKQDNQAIGVSKVFDQGAVGLSFNHFNTNYGTVAEQNVAISMIQNRWELNSEYNLQSSLFRKLKFKSAQSQYKHVEKDLGVVGTTFKNEGNESRFEALNTSGSVEGVSGIQTQVFDFGAIGDEAFLPESKNQKAALFTFQEMKDDQHEYTFAARVEGVKIDKKESSTFGAKNQKNFTSYNSSLGYLYHLNPNNSLAHNFSYTERAPTFQEIYAGGPHLATGTYEQGDLGLKKEKAYSVELSFKHKTEKELLTWNVYAQKYDGFINLIPTGETNSTSALPIFRYNQLAATFYGTDVENKTEIYKSEKGIWTGIVKADLIRGRETSSKNNLPRITPPRTTLGLEYNQDHWSVDGEIVHVLKQTQVAFNETKTNAYTLTNAGYTYNFLNDKFSLSTFLRVRNIFDIEARNHISTLKDIAPMPGRNAILGFQLSL
ncbi:MAG: TonB-dependent receptor [Bacteriovoracaceae bacterium]